ncbi:hypothetical protein ABI59_20655 [Acidobacteria bacterium Mor1]|nr:hypothetical protein ABI59_20655 [Acidobacteria bacterium Mor1]
MDSHEEVASADEAHSEPLTAADRFAWRVFWLALGIPMLALSAAAAYHSVRWIYTGLTLEGDHREQIVGGVLSLLFFPAILLSLAFFCLQRFNYAPFPIAPRDGRDWWILVRRLIFFLASLLGIDYLFR